MLNVRRGTGLLRYLPLILIPVAAAALILVLASRGDTQEASANAGHAGLDFSIGVDTNASGGDECSTSSGPFKCSVALSGSFRLRLYLNALPTGVATYEGFDALINFSNVTSTLTATSPDAGAPTTVGGNWPNCVFEAVFVGAGTAGIGCSIGISAPASTYTGRIGTMDLACPASNTFGTLTIVHGPGATELTENLTTKHSEGSGGTVAAPEALSITCGAPPTATRTLTPTPTLTRTPTITSTPTRTSTPTITPTPSNTPTATPLPSDQADVTITKTDSPDPVAAGGTITYSLVVKNLGQQTANGIVATDYLPAAVTYMSASGATCGHVGGDPGGSVNCNITGSLAQNQQVKIIIQVTAETPLVDEHITNLATVSASNEPFFNQGNNTEFEQTVVLSPRPDLVLTKTDAVDPIVSAGQVVYNLTVDNIGPEPAQNVVIKDNLLAGTTYDDGNSSPECDAGGGGPDPDVGQLDVICTLVGTVAGQATVHIAATAPTVTRDSIMVNLAYVSSSNELFTQTGNNLDGEFTAILAPDPDLTIDKAGPPHVKRVQKFQYTLTITNIGLGDAFGVLVSDTLPTTVINTITQPMTLQSVTGGATCNPIVGQTFTCTIAEVDASGGQVVLTVNVRAPTTLTNIDLMNQSSVSDPDELGEPTGNNSDNVTTSIRACFDVTGDNFVRIPDILTVMAHYLEAPPNPNFDLLYDFDGSSVITLVDVLAETQHYYDDVPCVK